MAAAEPPAAAAVSAPEPAAPADAPAAGGPARSPGRPRNRRRAGGAASRLGVIVGIVAAVVLAAGAYLATQAVYFVGLDQGGLVTVYRGVPYDCRSASTSTARSTRRASAAPSSRGRQRRRHGDHQLRSRDDADDLVRQLERGRVGTQ